MTLTNFNQIEQKKALVLTGTVYDLSTSGVGKNLLVTAIHVQPSVSEGGSDVLVPLKSSHTDAEGNYYIVIDEIDLPIVSGDLEITFGVSLNGMQLPQADEVRISLSVRYGEFINDIRIHSGFEARTVTGKVIYKNKRPAAFIKVELFEEGVVNPLAGSLTDINGVYSVSYNVEKGSPSQKKKAKRLYLKFYNRNDVYYKENEISLMDLADSVVNYQGTVNGFKTAVYGKTRSVEAGSGLLEFDLVAEEDVSTEGNKARYTYYYFVGKSLSNPSILIQRLVYVKIEIPEVKTDFWRIINVDSTTAKAVLEKRVDLEGQDFKNRILYTKAVPVSETQPSVYTKTNISGKMVLRNQLGMVPGTESGIYQELNKFYMETEFFKESLSPVFVTSRELSTINFKFSNDYLDLYTRLKTLKVEVLNQIEENLFTR